jgi:asparagine synthase (glutamine-hydrolysing)
MCGFAGLLHRTASQSAEELTETITRMTASLVHRGPDDEGIWVDAAVGLALGHRRLAVVDLSAAGHQPMSSACGRYVVVFNGEIYNHQALRRQLERAAVLHWRGQSDTETLLACVVHWGLPETLQRVVGMFALALYDRELDTLMLARDRLGEKPLYYGWQGGIFLFGSELKAFKRHPAFRAAIDRNALDRMLRTGYVAAPHTIYQGVHKVLPGTWLKLDSMRGEARIQSYWSGRQIVEAGLAAPFTGSAAEAVDQLDARLRQSIQDQQVADVPLGAFLSGGYDSSAVVALMQAQSMVPVKTFTIGFEDGRYDESGYAAAVARHLGTEHTALRMTPEDALAVIPRLPVFYDEPFADPSQIPTFLVSQLARRQVTVSLSGDGGDELFGGYDRYFRARKLWNLIHRLPAPVRSTLTRAIGGVPVEAWHRVTGHGQTGERLQKLAGLLGVSSPDVFYESFNAHWPATDHLVHGSDHSLNRGFACPAGDFENNMMYRDLMAYLPDDLLVKLDRAAMAVSLETRVPLLDHRIVEWAWHIPLSLKIRQGEGKWIMKQLVHRYIPRALVERPKMGFGIPLETWLRGCLRDWAESLLNENRLIREGYLVVPLIRRRWEQHRDGQRNGSYALWNVLMFQAWLEAQEGS